MGVHSGIFAQMRTILLPDFREENLFPPTLRRPCSQDIFRVYSLVPWRDFFAILRIDVFVLSKHIGLCESLVWKSYLTILEAAQRKIAHSYVTFVNRLNIEPTLFFFFSLRVKEAFAISVDAVVIVHHSRVLWCTFIRVSVAIFTPLMWTIQLK